MQKTLLNLVAGAVIGAGTVVTLPDGTTATTETPTVDDIYQPATVPVLTLSMDAPTGLTRYVYRRTSSILGVAAINQNKSASGTESVFNDVAAAAQAVCNQDPECTWTGLKLARSTQSSLVAALTGGGRVVLEDEIPSLTELKNQLADGTYTEAP